MDQKPTLSPESIDVALVALGNSVNMQASLIRMACKDDMGPAVTTIASSLKAIRKLTTAIEEIASHLPQEED